MSDTIDKSIKNLEEKGKEVDTLLEVKDALVKVGVFTPADIQVLENLKNINTQLLKTAESAKNRK